MPNREPQRPLSAVQDNENNKPYGHRADILKPDGTWDTNWRPN